jgi:hypothetical protein
MSATTTTQAQSNRSSLAAVTTAAFEQNGWDVFAIARTTDEAMFGVIAFTYSPAFEDVRFGTAAFESTRNGVGFQWGHYGHQSEGEAREDFAARTERGR